MTVTRCFIFMLGVILLMPAPLSAQPKPKEECAVQNGRFAEMRFCVSSMLAPQQDGDKYGPENFAGGEGGRVWCEGVTGYGIGETVSIHFKPAVRVQEFTLRNGNPKTPDAYKNNSRVKQLRIHTSDGFATVVTVPDKPDDHVIRLPRAAKPQWVRFSIVDVYPGARGADTCIAGILPNLEQLNN